MKTSNWSAQALALGLLMGALPAPSALAQQAGAKRIYTCVDNSGRTLTSDRPIASCIDREQRILDGVTGHQQGVLPPSYTEAERREIERQQQARQEEQRRLRDQRQRERVLLMRYPNQQAHDAARTIAKEQVQAVIRGSELRLEQLQEARQKLDAELEFYGNDLAKAPNALKRQFDNNRRDVEEQQRFIEAQRQELARIDALYDAELGALKALWGR
ncbi:DUF4124 domain-containing protein [Corticibacter populi]|uniref:DUF4124 domain-containing protein n=1 Tax=Corticibacter populi TaxID=1550736 RepID=A0A3M6QM95_9BURK|nr:DUF4124 domain-containing protein [Corticibacter populi]RMX04164.1 DUF4124 domain-containing protein [Corticibacter populi]RZS33184.1 uncharacterized protein DUF4124 [Corticibacter populi]